jgi:hypothetical protein
MTTIEQSEIEFLNKLLTSDQEIISDDYYKLSNESKKYNLKTILRNHDCEVKFKKVDGSLRTMPCTLRSSMIPTQLDESKESKKVKKENPEVISVFCLDKQEWRSFRVDNVISVKLLPELAN